MRDAKNSLFGDDCLVPDRDRAALCAVPAIPVESSDLKNVGPRWSARLIRLEAPRTVVEFGDCGMKVRSQLLHCKRTGCGRGIVIVLGLVPVYFVLRTGRILKLYLNH